MWRNIVALVALTVLTILAVLSVAGQADRSQAAEAERTITVTAFGSASAPATRTQLQFWFGSSDSETPTSINALQPVVDALMTGGIDAAALESGLLPTFGYDIGPPSSRQPWGQLLVTVDTVSEERLQEIVESVEAAADTAGLSVDYVGAAFGPADYSTLREQAMREAVEDARQHSAAASAAIEGLAGEITAIREEFPSFGPSGPTLCDMPLPFGWFGGYPPLEADVSTEVLFLPLVEVTFAVK